MPSSPSWTPTEENVDSLSQLAEIALVGIHAHEREESPNECVGFVASNGTTYRLRTVDPSPHRFQVEDAEIEYAFRWARASDLNLSCIYHSHPVTRANPSPVDIRFIHEQSLYTPFFIYGTDGLKGWYVSGPDADPVLLFHMERFDVRHPH